MNSGIALQGEELWRRQNARHLMDCYMLGMTGLSGDWERGAAGKKALEDLVRWMVEGITAVRTEEDEKSFYKTAAGMCRECGRLSGVNAGFFRIYATIFEEMAGLGKHGE